MSEKLTPGQRRRVDALTTAVEKVISGLARGLIVAALVIVVTVLVVLGVWWAEIPWWARLLLGALGGYYAVMLVQAAQILAVIGTLRRKP